MQAAPDVSQHRSASEFEATLCGARASSVRFLSRARVVYRQFLRRSRSFLSFSSTRLGPEDRVPVLGVGCPQQGKHRRLYQTKYSEEEKTAEQDVTDLRTHRYQVARGTNRCRRPRLSIWKRS